MSLGFLTYYFSSRPMQGGNLISLGENAVLSYLESTTDWVSHTEPSLRKLEHWGEKRTAFRINWASNISTFFHFDFCANIWSLPKFEWNYVAISKHVVYGSIYLNKVKCMTIEKDEIGICKVQDRKDLFEPLNFLHFQMDFFEFCHLL